MKKLTTAHSKIRGSIVVSESSMEIEIKGRLRGLFGFYTTKIFEGAIVAEEAAEAPGALEQPRERRLPWSESLPDTDTAATP